MQTSSRPATTFGRSRPPVSIPKVDLKSLLSSLRPELLRNPVLALPRRAPLVPRRPSCLKQRRPPSAADSGRQLTLSSRAKSYTLLTATYSQPATSKHIDASKETGAMPWPTEAGEHIISSENSSVMIDKQQLAAVLRPETTKAVLKTRTSEVELWDQQLSGKPLIFNAPVRPAFSRNRVIHSAHPHKPSFVRTSSDCDGLMLSPKVQERTTRMAVVTHMYMDPSTVSQPLLSVQRATPVCKRAKRLRKTKTMATFGTQTQEESARRGRIDIYFPIA